MIGREGRQRGSGRGNMGMIGRMSDRRGFRDRVEKAGRGGRGKTDSRQGELAKATPHLN